jgi:uncharacterized alkaline shock family protein YloU
MTGKDKPVYSPLSPDEAEALAQGRIIISNEVVAAIAAEASRKIKGVIIAGSSFRLAEMFGGKEGSSKGISVKTNEATGHVEIEAEVKVLYGVNIYETMQALQNQIRNDVEALTGSLIVDDVAIRVKDIVMPEEMPGEPVTPDRAMGAGLRSEKKKE